MTQTTSICPECIAPETVAAWRDGTLSAAEAARIATHLPECPACRAELAAYERLDAALRQAKAPEPDERLWQAVLEGMNGKRKLRRTGVSPRRLAGLAALAAVVLLAVGFAQVLHDRAALNSHTGISATPRSEPQGTPTPLPTAVPASPATDGVHLTWQQARLPIEPLTDQDILTFGIVPSNGESAYACHSISDNNGATLTFYRTTDRAQHWTILTRLTARQIDVADCMVQVDALDNNLVLIQIQGQNMQSLKEVAWYELTENGGTTWTHLNDSATLYDLSTQNGQTYALRDQKIGPGQFTQDLAVSTDHLQTWRPIAQSLSTPDRMVTNFWLNPGGGLLAEVRTSIRTSTSSATTSSSVTKPFSFTLWRSDDGGAHWELFPAPTTKVSGLLFATSFVVEQPVVGQSWHICTQYQSQTSTTMSLACTFDGGRTWSDRPLICPSTPCAPPQSMAVNITALANDGAVLMTEPVPHSGFQLGLYRLPQGSTIWQYLGPIAGSNAVFFAPASRGGALWAYAGGTHFGRLSGVIGGHQLLPDVLSTATYS